MRRHLRRTVLVTALLLLASPSFAISESEIIGRAQSGETAALLIKRIEHDRTVFVLASTDVDRLLGAGVPRDVVLFMRETPTRFGDPNAPAPPASTSTPAERTSVADLLELIQRGSSDASIVAELARRPPLVELTPADADRLSQSGASAALVRYILSKSERDQAPPASAPPGAATETKSARRSASAYRAAAPQRPRAPSFTDAGNVLVTGGVAVDREVIKGGGASTALTVSPRVGIFVLNGLLLEVELAVKLQEGPDSVAFLFDPGYYIRLGEAGSLAIFGQALVGYTKAGGASGPTGGFRVGLAIAPGQDVGPIIRIGPTMLWKKTSVADGSGSVTVKARTMTFGTDFGVWF
ncbi:MAG: hypothetical protein R3F39_21295 [Myxococcota bacterium]